VALTFRAYNLQDLGNDTVQANLLLHHPADARSYGVATSILVDLNLHRIALLTNNPEKIIAVEGPNKEVRVEKRVRMIPKAWRGEVGVEGKEIGEYLKTKVPPPALLGTLLMEDY
jgi:GTP cyclohydrolase II